MEKPLETDWMGLKVWWGRASGNHEDGANSVSQVDGDSDMVPACWLCGGRVQQRNNDLCQHFYLGESCPLSSHPVARKFSCSLYVSGALLELLPKCWSTEGVSPSKSLWGPLKGTPWDTRSLPFPLASIPTGFYSQELWGLLLLAL